MTDERTIAVRRVREEADKLRIACIAAAGSGALLHVAYDRGAVARLNTDEAVLLGRLRGIQ